MTTIEQERRIPDGRRKEPENNTSFYLAQIAERPLLSADQEKSLAGQIFTAQLALRNIRNTIEYLPVQQQAKLREFISAGRAKDFLDSLDNTIIKRKQNISTLEEELGEQDGDKEEEYRHELEALKSLISDVDDNDRLVEEKIRLEGTTQEFAKLQLDLFHQGSKAYDLFVKANLRLVVSIARKYPNSEAGLSLLDLIQEGNTGLMTAALKFDFRMGNKFSTYATSWIRQAIQRTTGKTGNPVRIPLHMLTNMRRVTQKQEELQLERREEVSIKEAAEAMGLDPELIEYLFKLKQTSSLDSLNDNKDGEPDLELTLLSVVRDNAGNSVEAEAEENWKKEKIREVLSSLPPRERLVLERRFGFYDGKSRTLEETGREFGVTRERIRQIQARALRKLRVSAHARRLRDLLD